MNADTTPLIFVLYDSITNSVFESQVQQLLQKKAQKNPYRPIHLVTFERTIQEKHFNTASIRITYLKRIPFIGTITIMYAARQLAAFLRSFPEYHLIARGPIAGLIAKKAYTTRACKSLIIQARGLLADEYAYTHARSTLPHLRFLHALRTRQLYAVEKKAYAQDQQQHIRIETITKALKDRLVGAFEVSDANITIAHDDIPQKIDEQQKQTWRTATRTELGIAHDATVYCYNGSAKSWQRPDLIIDFFKEQLQKNDTAFLLIITTEREAFIQQLTNAIPAHKYALISVAHQHVYRYLCAADHGLLFRDDHIINWVSRPIKALEYHAVGLPIIHNNTVDFVIRL